MTTVHVSEQPPLMHRCESPAALWEWVRRHLGLSVPRHGVCTGHGAPFEYLSRAYFEPGQDLVVWASRGGGKTRLGAVATLLDLLHKPRSAVRILGGSLEQSLRMWEHLIGDVEQLHLPLARSRAHVVQFTNRSHAAVLAQSQRAVRGQRVQKLRCDEVEMFDADVWAAAQLVTRSIRGDWPGAGGPSGGRVRGTVEALSTMHKVGGLMSRVVDQASTRGGTWVIKWCVMEVLERCGPERECGSCPLWDECRGVAKTRCEGFFPIDDAIRMKSRVSQTSWQSEMLCRRPSVERAVFPMFDPAVHVREAPDAAAADAPAAVSLAMDFGFANPFVCLWVARHGAGDDEVVHVIDEYVQSGQAIHEHVDEVERRGWSIDRRIACDPAGAARNEQTAQSNVQYLRQRGYSVRYRPSRIIDGIEAIRTGLRPAWGRPRLFVHPRCVRLIEALQGYSYGSGGGELPVKDGVFDHPVDALRYWMINRGGWDLAVRRY